MTTASGPALSRISICVLSIVLGGALSTAGCIGVSAKRAGAGGPGTAPTLKCRAYKPAADGAIDDFEDGNNQATKLAGRGDYWYAANDPKGSTIALKFDEPGAGGSEMGAHITGVTAAGKAEDGTWGAQLGLHFVAHAMYDASKYAGIAFKAKAAPGSAHNVRFKIGDINTHPDGNLCKACWNHWGKDLSLTEDWKTYTITFSGAEQEPGWGDPRPAALVPNQLAEMNWSIGPGLSYDFWFDDVTFVDCE